MYRDYRKGDRALYYGSTVTILHADLRTALVSKGPERFSVDYRLLTPITVRQTAKPSDSNASLHRPHPPRHHRA